MVRIITDSSADFEPWELEKLNITCIPIQVMLDDKEYEENRNLTKAQFFQLLEETGVSPKTSQPSPKHLMDAFAAAIEAGEEALYITMSSGISGTYQSACMIREEMESDLCFVLDSLNATAGQRIQVEYAVRLRDAGKSAAEIMEAIQAIQGKFVLYACLDTLEYLYRGGRISQTVYKLSTMAQVKPIIRVAEDGTIEVPAKALGMRKGIDWLVKKAEQHEMDPNHRCYLMYTADDSNAQLLAQKLREQGMVIEADQIVPVGAGIGSHVGPQVCGFVFVEK